MPRLSYGGFPIRTKAMLALAAPEYFKPPSQREPGPKRHAKVPLLLTADGTTMCVVEVQSRKLKPAIQMVRNNLGNAYQTRCDYYVMDGRSWRVIEVTWESGDVAELSTHHRRDDADRALVAAHAL